MKRLRGIILVLIVTISLIWIGEPLSPDTNLSWRNVVALFSIPWLSLLVGYRIGWINGHHVGWTGNKETK